MRYPDLAALDKVLGAARATLDTVGSGTSASRILTAMEAALSVGTEFSRYGSPVHQQL